VETEAILRDKRILAVDDEKDVLESLKDILWMCRLETAFTFEGARDLLESRTYDSVILDIMGVRGFDLLELAARRGIPALILTAHGLNMDNLKKAIRNGAAFFAPKEKLGEMDVFLADVLTAKQRNRSSWAAWGERLLDFFGRKFGEDWRDKDPEFWKNLEGRW
jgi:DNA-binding NtrC family response regulator